MPAFQCTHLRQRAPKGGGAMGEKSLGPKYYSRLQKDAKRLQDRVNCKRLLKLPVLILLHTNSQQHCYFLE